MKKVMLATAPSLALFGTAFAADIGYRPPPAVAPVVPVVLPFSWTGCYLGGFAGGAWTGDVRVFDPYGNFVGVPSDTWGYSIDSSFIGGGTAGCNWQLTGTPWVVGIEGEFGYMSLKGSGFDPLLFPFGPNALFASTKIGNGYGMITGRVGYAVDRVLFYAKGGVAFVDESVTVAHPTLPGFGIPAVAVTVDNNDARWTVGGRRRMGLYQQLDVQSRVYGHRLGQQSALRLRVGRAGSPGWKLLLEPQRAKRGEHIQGWRELSIRRWHTPLRALLTQVRPSAAANQASSVVCRVKLPEQNSGSFFFREGRTPITPPRR